MAEPSKGPCTRRLENLQCLSKADQIYLLHSIAVDMQTTFSCIGQHLSHGTLSSSSAEPIYELVRTICKRNAAQQQRLKEKICSMRGEKHWMRKEYRRLHVSTRAMAQAYTVKVRRLQSRVRVLQMRLSCVTQERYILTRGLGRELEHEGPGEAAFDEEGDSGRYEIAARYQDGDRRRNVELDFVV